MINSEKLDRDWYEGIVQKLKWNLPIREDKSGGPPSKAPSRRCDPQASYDDNQGEYDECPIDLSVTDDVDIDDLSVYDDPGKEVEMSHDNSNHK